MSEQMIYTTADVDGHVHIFEIERHLLEDILRPICGDTLPQITTAPDTTISISEALLEIVTVPTVARCPACWDRAIRLKHPRLLGSIR